MISKTVKLIFLLGISALSTSALASEAAPPEYASLLVEVWHFIKTTGLEIGLTTAGIGLGMSKMLNTDKEWVQRMGNFAMGAGAAFALPEFALTLFGASGFSLAALVAG
jgi:hypothetical protein